MKQSVFHFIPVAFRRHLGSSSLQYISARSGIFLHAGIFIHTFEERIINFTPRSGWSRCRRQRVHPRATDYLIGGSSKPVSRDSTETRLTDQVHLGSPGQNLGLQLVGCCSFFQSIILTFQTDSWA